MLGISANSSGSLDQIDPFETAKKGGLMRVFDGIFFGGQLTTVLIS
ncbi:MULTISPECIES: hypothetical protein [Rhizobiaceae]|uniref:Uncharacterized protein n=1 Tax=Rhizobium tropici TaxID=398 RepID=A0ABR6R4D4_RHITR|nr:MULTISPECIES: hypothetical protein [Rhizobiaceae]AGB73104.1 hypothetical protein RTCIAT899_PA00005 [Rhizobium tropici CIAT 899]AEI89537.1 hypothetical protein SFGR64A_00001 [Sinorhizobium fredii GR64]MBB4243608.1 hypothetical protein [Rhizobium tropici]MBB5595486.1 hypothetical protein [Rhizobium tropici]MBB6493936.1 hypothetical protein [Rhizobium tropici]